MEVLTLKSADRLCTAALAAGRNIGFAATAAVVDAGGHVIALHRDDGALFLTVQVARQKAWTAAASGVPTELWNTLTTAHEVGPIVQTPGILAVAGGLPILAGDRVIGALGVSGGTAVQDRDAACAALAAFDPE